MSPNQLAPKPKTVESIVLACCCLHNSIRLRYPALLNAVLHQEDDNHLVIPRAWRDGVNFEDMNIVEGNLATRAEKQQRHYLKHYYSSPAGAVPWQNDRI